MMREMPPAGLAPKNLHRDASLGACILLVDDHPPNLLALQAVLEPLAVRLVTASSGEEALKCVLRDDFALILMDVRMTGLSGVDTAALIRSRDRSRHTPIILLTAHDSDDAEVLRGYAHGVVDYLRKPFSPEVLRAKVSTFVELYLAREEIRRQAALLRAKDAELLERAHQRKLRELLEEAPAAICITRGLEFVFEFVNPLFERVVGRDVPIGARLAEVLPEVVRQPEVMTVLERVMATGETFTAREFPIGLNRRRNGGLEQAFFHLIYQPTRDTSGRVEGVVTFAVEVTESVRARREAETMAAAVQAREAEFRRLAENIPDIVARFGPDGTVLYVNPALERLTGITAEELLHKPSSELGLPEDVMGAWTDALARCLAGEPVALSVQADFRGEPHSLQARLVPERDGGGQVLSALCILRDVTEERRHEEILRLSERQFRELAEAMPQLVWTSTVDGVVEYRNSRWMEYSGVTDADLAEGRAAVAIHPDDVERTLRGWRAAVRAKEPFEVEFRMRNRNGAYRWFLARAVPVRDGSGRIVKWFGTATDIDDQKRAEQTQQLLADVTKELSSSLDHATTLTRVAELAVPRVADVCAVFLLTKDDAFEHHALAHRDGTKIEAARELLAAYVSRPEWPGGVHDTLRRGERVHVEEVAPAALEAHARDARQIELLRLVGLRSYVIVPLQVRDRVIGAMFFAYTEAERRYRPHDARLLEELGSRAAIAIENSRLFEEAQTLIAALERSNQELDHFAYVASHDLKAPLRGIDALSEWLVEDLGDQLGAEAKKHADLLRGRVRRMEALIEGILSYSRAARVRTAAEDVDVAALVRDTLDLLSVPATARVELAPDLPVLRTERTALQQVFMNLIGNALKYAQRADVHVRVGGRDAGAFYEFAVSDDGPGIDPRYHERIWALFQTLAARDRVESTGVGLSIVRALVDRRGGRAWVESREGQGATFRFTWPKGER